MRKISFFEAVCLVAGSGIGGGVMAVPYLVSKTGLIPAVFVMLIAYAVTLVLHVMVAELSLRSQNASELLSVFHRHLFRGKKPLSVLFYFLMAFILCANLAAYIAGAGETLAAILPVPKATASALFFLAAAAVVFLGLRKVAASEARAVIVMLAILAALAVLSLIIPKHQSLSFPRLSLRPVLAVYGMVMFSLSALFSVPQAAASMENAKKRILPAVALGLLINLAVIFLICLLTLLCSEEVTEVAIIGWSRALGPAVNILGSLFIVLAMLSTFWSISLQLSDMTRELFHAGRKTAWLVATLPSFVLALLPVSSFLELMRLAGGAVAVVIALMVIPAYLNAARPVSNGLLLGKAGKSRVLAATVILFYILMTVGSFL